MLVSLVSLTAVTRAHGIGWEYNELTMVTIKWKLTLKQKEMRDEHKNSFLSY